MNRELKFRGLYQGKLVYGLYIQEYVLELSDGDLHIRHTIEVLDEDRNSKHYIINDGKIEQYTGLKDSKGVDIYEGDIIINRSLTGEVFKTGTVEWGVFDIGANGHEYSFEVVGPYVESEYLYGEMINGGVEIVGNIHEGVKL